MCDVEGCQKIFFDVSKLREHALLDHANETFRKMACAEAGKIVSSNLQESTSVK